MADFRSGPYLTFRVGRQELALDAHRVTAILPAHELIASEDPNSDIAGEAMLRGNPFPVVDLRRRLQLRSGISGRTPCIVVLDCGGFIGLLVDAVSEIIHARKPDYRNGKLRIGRPKQIVDVAKLCEPVAS